LSFKQSPFWIIVPCRRVIKSLPLSMINISRKIGISKFRDNTSWMSKMILWIIRIRSWVFQFQLSFFLKNRRSSLFQKLSIGLVLKCHRMGIVLIWPWLLWSSLYQQIILTHYLCWNHLEWRNRVIMSCWLDLIPRECRIANISHPVNHLFQCWFKHVLSISFQGWPTRASKRDDSATSGRCVKTWLCLRVS